MARSVNKKKFTIKRGLLAFIVASCTILSGPKPFNNIYAINVTGVIGVTSTIAAPNGNQVKLNGAKIQSLISTSKAPDKPILYAYSAQVNQVSLYWPSENGATGYTLKRSMTAGGPYTTIKNLYSAETKYIDSSVKPGVTYYYVITASNAGGESPLSNEVSSIPQLASPNNFNASGENEKITLTWDPSPGADSYTIQRCTDDGNKSTPMTDIATDVTTTTYTDTNVNLYQKYYYNIRAKNAGSTSDYNFASAAPKISLPEAPTGVTAVAKDCRIELSWDIMPKTSYYYILRATALDGEYTQLLDTTSKGIYVDTTAMAGTVYYYKIVGYNSSGYGARSNAVSATALPPLPPSNVQVTAGAGWTRLKWAPSPSAKSFNITYTVLRSTESGGPYKKSVDKWNDTNLYTRGLTTGYTYYYIVEATTDYGTSIATKEVSVRVPHYNPSILSASPDVNKVRLSWTAASEATTYTIKRSIASGGPYTDIATLSSTSYIDSSVAAGIEYYYVVTASSADGEQASSEEASAIPNLAAPENFKASGKDGKVTLTWDPSPGADSYTIRKRISESGLDSIEIAKDVTTTTYTDTDVSYYTEYIYSICAKNPSNASEYAFIHAKLDLPLAAAPANVTAAIKDCNIEICWDKVPYADSYVISRATSLNGIYTVLGSANEGIYIDSTAKAGTTYYYAVAGKNDTGIGSSSSVVSAGLPFKYGDLNGDGKVYWDDYTLLKDYVLRKIKSFPTQNSPLGRNVADLNGDGKITSVDCAYLIRFLNKLIVKFPVEINK